MGILHSNHWNPISVKIENIRHYDCWPGFQVSDFSGNEVFEKAWKEIAFQELDCLNQFL